MHVVPQYVNIILKLYTNCIISATEYFSCINLGTIVNNLEGCDILKSSHFNMASQLLEVCM